MWWFLSETMEQMHQDWGTVLREEIQHQGGMEEKYPAGSSTWMDCCTSNPPLAILKLSKTPVSWQLLNPISSSIRICVSMSDYGWDDGMACCSLYIAKEMPWHSYHYVTWSLPLTKNTWERKLLQAFKWEPWYEWVEREAYVTRNCGRHNRWEQVPSSSKQWKGASVPQQNRDGSATTTWSLREEPSSFKVLTEIQILTLNAYHIALCETLSRLPRQTEALQLPTNSANE